MNFIKHARELAALCPDPVKKKNLRNCADDLHDVFGRFAVSCDKDDMQALVGAWTRTAIAILLLPPLPEHRPDGGRLRKPLTDAA